MKLYLKFSYGSTPATSATAQREKAQPSLFIMEEVGPVTDNGMHL
jgi:hypothetical protein